MNGLVLFGDVIRSRSDAPAATAWLRTLASDLTSSVPSDDRLAPFEFTQGDEIQGLLAPGADPIAVVLRAILHSEALPMRWVVSAGDVDPGHGPATQRSGAAFITARERLRLAAVRRERLAVVAGDPEADKLLDGTAPLLGALLAELTDRQREIGWLILVEGLRRSEVAGRLGVSRATVSVAAERAHLRALGGLADVVRTLLARATVAA
ncbi:MAG TPA: sigma factor-like helix-turn-helix DNA-binding protein [Patescibacteria group bacterium]|nr:sigma factor-like helix-turn-helix DNA-binding protein [Patescibacteria group bacterium]